MPYRELMDYTIDQVKKHGLPMLMLMLAVWYIERRSAEMEHRLYDCNAHITEIYKEMNVKMMQVIESNTHAIQEVRKEIDE